MRRDNFLLIFKFVVPNPASSGEDLFFCGATKKQTPHVKSPGMTDRKSVYGRALWAINASNSPSIVGFINFLVSPPHQT